MKILLFIIVIWLTACSTVRITVDPFEGSDTVYQFLEGCVWVQENDSTWVKWESDTIR